MAARLERAQSHIHAIATATSEQRVAAALVMLAERTGTPRKGSILLDVPLSRDDLASLTGTVSETVSRVLAQLRRDGVIETVRRWVDRNRVVSGTSVSVRVDLGGCRSIKPHTTANHTVQAHT